VINPISPINPISQGSSTASGESKGNTDFKKILGNAIDKVNSTVENAEQATQDFATGKTTDISSVLVTAEKADIALQLTTEITNKIISSYQDIMRMQI
jgi:flagellar hook-basal body complex protein FliE